MAKTSVNIDARCREIILDVRNGIFKPVYLLMGEEPYYPDMVCQEIIDHCLDESERDFNQTICFGSDVDADTVISAARRYPMMADRQLVVVKEAQLMKDIDEFSLYCANPLDSTVLVILMHGTSPDKRKAFYKSVQKVGVVVDSPLVRDYEITDWIINYYNGRGLSIAPNAARLLAEYAGVSLGTIAVETDKLLKALPEGTGAVTAEDIEKNVGISRQYNIFELTKELSMKNKERVLRIASHLGDQAKFAMPMATAMLFTHFNRILKYGALLLKDRNPAPDAKAKALGVNPFFFKEYDIALSNYPVPVCMRVIALLEDYDFKGKGGDVSQETMPGTLLVELVTKILNI